MAVNNTMEITNHLEEQTVDDDAHVYTVSQLNQTSRLLLESHFSTIAVTGEVSNFICARSGHWYFSLKDNDAQVRCAMFRGYNQQLPFTLEDGWQVLLQAKVSVYEARGDYQLIVSHIVETGAGALYRAYLDLKKRLSKQGLFSATHKKSIPYLPQCVGVITSAHGAAIRDVLITLKRRCPAIDVIIYPCQVQGKQAAGEITHAITLANQRNECDVLLLVRGGGSLEDLWPFNEEIVAHAVYDSEIPIVCGVGHEVDESIADFVADLRAPTPTAAAEAVSPDQADLSIKIQQLMRTLLQTIKQHLREYTQHIDHLKKRLPKPQQQLRQWMQCCDQVEQNLHHLLKAHWQEQRHQLQHIQHRLQQQQPALSITIQQQTLQRLSQQLQQHIKYQLKQTKQSIGQLSQTLHTVSPLATLARGYAIASDEHDHILRNAKRLHIGQQIKIRLHAARLLCTLNEINT